MDGIQEKTIKVLKLLNNNEKTSINSNSSLRMKLLPRRRMAIIKKLLQVQLETNSLLPIANLLIYQLLKLVLILHKHSKSQKKSTCQDQTLNFQRMSNQITKRNSQVSSNSISKNKNLTTRNSKRSRKQLQLMNLSHLPSINFSMKMNKNLKSSSSTFENYQIRS